MICVSDSQQENMKRRTLSVVGSTPFGNNILAKGTRVPSPQSLFKSFQRGLVHRVKGSLSCTFRISIVASDLMIRIRSRVNGSIGSWHRVVVQEVERGLVHSSRC